MTIPEGKGLIFEANYKNDGYVGVLSFEYLVGDVPHRMAIDLEHPDLDAQARGQRAFSLLCRACGIVTIDDASELLEKEFSLRVIDDIDAIIGRDKRQANKPDSVAGKGGFVYVISGDLGDRKICKIGIAASPERRLSTLSTASPAALRLEATRFFENPRAVEASAHHYFRSKRANGEWFSIPVSDAVAYLFSQAA